MSAPVENQSSSHRSSSVYQFRLLPKPPTLPSSLDFNQSKEAPSYANLLSNPATFGLSLALFETPYSINSPAVIQLFEEAFRDDMSLRSQLQKVSVERKNSAAKHPSDQSSHVVLEALFREAIEVKRELATEERDAQKATINGKKEEEHGARRALLQDRMNRLQDLADAWFGARKLSLGKIIQQTSLSSAVNSVPRAQLKNKLDDLNFDMCRMYQLFKIPLYKLICVSQKEKDWQIIIDAFAKKLEHALNNADLEKNKSASDLIYLRNINIYIGTLYEAFFVFYQENKYNDYYINNNLMRAPNWQEIDKKFIHIKCKIKNIALQKEGSKKINEWFKIFQYQESTKTERMNIDTLNENFFKVYYIFSKIKISSLVGEDSSSSSNFEIQIKSIFNNMHLSLQALKNKERMKEFPNKEIIDSLGRHIDLLKEIFLECQKEISNNKKDINQVLMQEDLSLSIEVQKISDALMQFWGDQDSHQKINEQLVIFLKKCESIDKEFSKLIKNRQKLIDEIERLKIKIDRGQDYGIAIQQEKKLNQILHEQQIVLGEKHSTGSTIFASFDQRLEQSESLLSQMQAKQDARVAFYKEQKSLRIEKQNLEKTLNILLRDRKQIWLEVEKLLYQQKENIKNMLIQARKNPLAHQKILENIWRYIDDFEVDFAKNYAMFTPSVYRMLGISISIRAAEKLTEKEIIRIKQIIEELSRRESDNLEKKLSMEDVILMRKALKQEIEAAEAKLEQERLPTKPNKKKIENISIYIKALKESLFKMPRIKNMSGAVRSQLQETPSYSPFSFLDESPNVSLASAPLDNEPVTSDFDLGSFLETPISSGFLDNFSGKTSGDPLQRYFLMLT